MTKNILVTDSFGTTIGSTYPKRAKGLVKSGRAVFVSEDEIRMTEAASDAFSDANIHYLEDIDMSKIINFNARAFKFVKSCETNQGARLMVTENGKSVELFELSVHGEQSQIRYELELEPEEEYVFRFAVKSRFIDAARAESLVAITFEDPEDGYIYPMDRSDGQRYQPLLSKKVGDDLFRVYEMKFQSGSDPSCRIEFVLHDMTMWLYPAQELEAYADLENADYEQYLQDEIHRFTRKMAEFGNRMGEGMSDLGGNLGEKLGEFGDIMESYCDKLTKAVSGMWKSASEPKAEGADPKAADTGAEEAKETASGEKTSYDRYAEEAAKAADEAAEKLRSAAEIIRKAATQAAETVAENVKVTVETVVEEVKKAENAADDKKDE